MKIRRIEVIGECKVGDPALSLNCQFAPANIGVEKFLDLASLGDHERYCLSYVFAHRDFSGGVLGLAWIGDGTLLIYLEPFYTFMHKTSLVKPYLDTFVLL